MGWDIALLTSPTGSEIILADRTIGRADRTIGRAFDTLCRLSVSVICLPVTFCIVAKRCVLAKKCLKE